MLIYIAYLLLLSVQAVLFHRGIPVPTKTEDGETVFVRKDGKRFFLMLSCAELIILAGIRGYTVGADTKTYLDALTEYTGISFGEIFTAKLTWLYKFETGYFLLTKICGFVHMHSTLFLTIIACIIYIPLFRYIYKRSTHPYISVIVYFAFGFFSYSLGIFRQFIAIGIILSGLRFIEEKKLIKYIITVLFAMLFHTTALLALPLYFAAKIKWRTKPFIIAILAGEAGLLVVGRIVIQLAIKLFPSYEGYLNGKFDIRGGSYLNLIFLNIILFAFIFAHRDTEHGDTETELVCAQLVFAIFLQCCAYHMEMFGRIVPYFSMSLMIAIPKIIDGFGKKDKVFTFVLKVCACLVLFLLVFRDLNGNKYITPFYFFWQQVS